MDLLLLQMKHKRFNAKDWDWTSFVRSDPRTKAKYKALANQLASSWQTCACGQYANEVERRLGNAPLDQTLYNLGIAFSSCIENQAWIGAEVCLMSIKRRVRQLT